MYQALPALPYCKRRKAGRGTGYEARPTANTHLEIVQLGTAQLLPSVVSCLVHSWESQQLHTYSRVGSPAKHISLVVKMASSVSEIWTQSTYAQLIRLSVRPQDLADIPRRN